MIQIAREYRIEPLPFKADYRTTALPEAYRSLSEIEMSRSLQDSPQQIRVLALAENAGMKGIRSADAVAGELALLSEESRTKDRKHVITANVCHALKKLCKRGVLIAFRAPDGLRYFSVAVLRAEDAMRNPPLVVQPTEVNSKPIEQQTAAKPQPETTSFPGTQEEWLETIRRGCATAATSQG
jgi:hypothetical protein